MFVCVFCVCIFLVFTMDAKESMDVCVLLFGYDLGMSAACGWGTNEKFMSVGVWTCFFVIRVIP